MIDIGKDKNKLLADVMRQGVKIGLTTLTDCHKNYHLQVIPSREYDKQEKARDRLDSTMAAFLRSCSTDPHIDSLFKCMSDVQVLRHCGFLKP